MVDLRDDRRPLLHRINWSPFRPNTISVDSDTENDDVARPLRSVYRFIAVLSVQDFSYSLSLVGIMIFWFLIKLSGKEWISLLQT